MVSVFRSPCTEADFPDVDLMLGIRFLWILLLRFWGVGHLCCYSRVMGRWISLTCNPPPPKNIRTCPLKIDGWFRCNFLSKWSLFRWHVKFWACICTTPFKYGNLSFCFLSSSCCIFRVQFMKPTFSFLEAHDPLSRLVRGKWSWVLVNPSSKMCWMWRTDMIYQYTRSSLSKKNADVLLSCMYVKVLKSKY